MVEKLYKEDFGFGAVLFIFALGVFVLGYASYLFPTGSPMLDYSLPGTLLVSGVAGFFSLVVSIKAVRK